MKAPSSSDRPVLALPVVAYRALHVVYRRQPARLACCVQMPPCTKIAMHLRRSSHNLHSYRASTRHSLAAVVEVTQPCMCPTPLCTMARTLQLEQACTGSQPIKSMSSRKATNTSITTSATYFPDLIGLVDWQKYCRSPAFEQSLGHVSQTLHCC